MYGLFVDRSRLCCVRGGEREPVLKCLLGSGSSSCGGGAWRSTPSQSVSVLVASCYGRCACGNDQKIKA